MQELTSGTLLRGGAYEIDKVLGQGSFGITYLAEHTALGRKVCIKEFFMKELNSRSENGCVTGMTESNLSLDYAQKFRKEAKNLSQLEHPNIVRVTDCFDENGTFYYVMDYVEGHNLNGYLCQHSATREEAVSIITDVARALEYMHEKKQMLHLDLKPSNVMRRDDDGHIFLIDFGLSKHYSENGAPETSTTVGMGTAGYSPIEQGNQAKNGEIRPTIDIYALGATFYKLLTGEVPPVASELVSDPDILHNSLLAHDVPATLADIVINAMRPNVNMRIQTVKEFIHALSLIDISVLNNSGSASITGEQEDEITLYLDEPKNNDNDASGVSSMNAGIVGNSVSSGKSGQPQVSTQHVPVDSQKKTSSKKSIIVVVIAIVVIAILTLLAALAIAGDSDSNEQDAVEKTASAVEEASSAESSQSDADLKQAIEEANAGLPGDIDNGVVLRDITLEEDYAVFNLVVDEENFTVEDAENNPEASRELLLGFVDSEDSDVNNLMNLLREHNKGLAIKYIGEISGDTYTAKMSSEKLFGGQ